MGLAWLSLHMGYSVALTVTRRTAYFAWSPFSRLSCPCGMEVCHMMLMAQLQQ